MTTNAVPLPSTMHSRPLQRWEIFSILMLIIMDLCWITPVYSLLGGNLLVHSPSTVFFILGTIYVLSTLIANIPKYVDVVMGVVQLALLAVLVLGVIWAANQLLYFNGALSLEATIRRYLSELVRFSIPIKPELLLSLVLFLLWRRGFSLANHSIGLGLIRRSFRIGAIMLIVTGVFAALFSTDLPYIAGGAFILSSLLAMGGARLATLGSMRGSKPVPFRRQWVLGLIVMASLMLVIAVSFGAFAAGPFASWIAGALRALERSIGALLKVILAPVIDFMGMLFTYFLSLFEPQPEQDPTAVDALEEGLEGPIAEIQRFTTDPEVAALLSTLGTVLGILIIVGIIFFAVRKFRRESKPRIMGEEDLISASGSLSDYLRGIGDRARQAFESVRGMNPAARLIAAARIRIVYARLLRLGARLGEPRAPAVTPIEYLASLDRIFPASRDELELITEAYLRIRYGELPETSQQVEAVESAWSMVRRRGRAV